MSEYAYFYNSKDGDRVYSADSFSNWLKSFFSDGVLANTLQVTANDNLTVTVSAGTALIGGKVKIFDEETTLSLPSSSATYQRINNIVVRRDDDERDIYLAVVQGTGTRSSITPSAPTITREGNIYELVLAQVYEGVGVSAISQSNITDTRSDEDMCGYIIGNTDILEASQLYAQNDAAFNEWFENVKGVLGADEAGNLLNLINDIASNVSDLEERVEEAENNVLSTVTQVAENKTNIATNTSNIANKAPTSHASSTASTYGAGTASKYGHVKLSNTYSSSVGAAADSLAASQSAVYNAYNTLNSGKAATSHASSSTTYGAGTASNYGHVKLSNTYTSSVGAASDSLGASQTALYNAYAALLDKWSSTVTSTGNLNNYKTAGVYYFSSSYTPTNIPEGVNGWLMVLTYGSTAIKQLWFRHGTVDTNDFHIFVRTYASSTWSEWRRIITNGSSPSFESVEIAEGIELTNSTPYIDFHYGSSSKDWTTRITETATGVLRFYKSASTSSYATCYASSWSTASSRKVKDDIQTITDDEAKALLSLEPTTFVFKGDSERSAGLIAEDVYKILPLIVKLPDDYDIESDEDSDDIPGIDYSQLTPYLIKMIQIQDKQIEAQQSQMEALEARLAAIEAKLEV